MIIPVAMSSLSYFTFSPDESVTVWPSASTDVTYTYVKGLVTIEYDQHNNYLHFNSDE